jgi:hypothetical protein
MFCILCTVVYAKDKLPKSKDKDMMRKMIVYDKVRGEGEDVMKKDEDVDAK